ncbi:NAD(P)-dependent dehydrogenase (short-subunit alcohol dehydrogenase family) [Amycolatopsis bartoniae]|uniref:3-hydroxyacyl-CoA dehydrogenase n=1 Tax=Amycolatopsis bartoniae TaxID=941986 RepID=A0A8H9MBN2_9PSEU|nr:SDR family NAD(P)-dependent oxidoreductase [Amycolatopsis bartoniae]MBB2939659.1 NAD(P)-dependent dehydrogenase (short-subunit alcohol dehydrogenase family) [Amycolatopsis bartoniae]TVT06234.1 SDR family NAD(P)-dependent oxidoreductase [Amycolatopsis bartoniae]GHF36709.1 3-hydroxyacyl-CoA dehydrogenase [Amycolatopsis bartoniae]
MEIAGSAAIVTGGAGGLGEATVRRLAGAGARVVIADLAEQKAKALADELGPSVAVAVTDVTDEDSVQAAVDAASELGPLRIAVNAHGAPSSRQRVVNREGKPADFAGFKRTLEVYLAGTFNVLRLAAARMGTGEPNESGTRGVVVNTASIAAFEGQIGQIDYAAAKSGVVGIGLVAARDLSPLGIRVMTIAPGTFFTPAFRMDEQEAQEKWGKAVPFPKRMGRPAEYAHLVASIVENDYLNGEVIRLDGAQRFGPK